MKFFPFSKKTLPTSGLRTKIKVARDKNIKYSKDNIEKAKIPSLINKPFIIKKKRVEIIEDTLTDFKTPKLDNNEGNFGWKSILGELSKSSYFLKENIYKEPTEIQRLLMPQIFKGIKNVFGGAETGSGKTLAYLLPLCMNLKKMEEKGEKGLIMICLPTLELINQVKLVAKNLSHHLKFKVRSISEEDAEQGDVLIGFPNQFLNNIDGILKKNSSNMGNLALVIDEADTLLMDKKRFNRKANLSRGKSFAEECNFLLNALTDVRKVVVSATMPPSLLKKLQLQIPVLE